MQTENIPKSLNISIFFSQPDPQKPNNLLQLDGIGINMVIKDEIETFSGEKKVRKKIGNTSGSQVGLYAFQVAGRI